MTVLSGKSQENLPNLPATHLYWAGGVPDLSVSPSPSCRPIRDAARPAPSQSEWKRPSPLWQWNQPDRLYVTHIFWLFFTYSTFSFRNIHFIWRNTYRQKIAKRIIEKYRVRAVFWPLKKDNIALLNILVAVWKLTRPSFLHQPRSKNTSSQIQYHSRLVCRKRPRWPPLAACVWEGQ